MGSTSSKFRKALQTGDEKTAEEIYHSSQEFQKSLDPNMSYGENYQHNTPLHYASRHGMHRLIRCSLQKHHGNPNKRNTLDQTSLHCVCMEEVHRPPSSTSSYSQYYYSQPPEKKRAECLRLIVGWKGIKMGSGEREQVDVNAVDEDGNSALHYAASSGYRSLVEMLLEHGASLFQENVDKETPCDCAEKNHNYDIAQLLESKMVFSQNSEDEPVGEISAIQYEESYSGMRPQELQEAKDVLVVETADMLRVPLFTAEALLRNHEWSREALLEGWMNDPAECCENSGVKPPENLGSFVAEHQLTTMDAATPDEKTEEEDQDDDAVMCDICTCGIEISVDTPCSHQFCKACWEKYLSGKIAEGNAHNIVCPAYPCDKLVPVEIIENVVSREMSRRYLQFDIKAFVESHPNLKWCPIAGCGRAVKLPDVDTPQRETTPSPTSPPPMSHAVDCGQGHIFCWNCSGDPHEPCSCENWKRWQEKVAEVKPEDLSSLDVETESASNYLWLVTNSKPCPKCGSPIQKNEGCNHMKCTKCKHDFCWVCLEPWSKHSSETGGYFRCNRFEVVQKVEEKAESLLTDAEKKNKDMQELNRFLHYYSRYKNHGHSHKLEEPLMKKAPSKMKKLACHTSQPNEGPGDDTKFIEEAIQELLKARRTLKFSYPYGYYLEDRGGSKQIFEFMQNELEDSTESLSQMVARHYLRTPRHKIIQTAQLVVRKRHEFLCAVSKGFLPPETPPTSRRQTLTRSWESDSDEEDEALRRAIEVSLQEAMAQNQQQQQQENSEAGEEDNFLPAELRNSKSSHGRERRRHDSGNRDSSSMTAGLLRALEMSQLLLMQQTERLGQPGSSSTQDDSGSHDNQAEHAGSCNVDASSSGEVAARPLTSSTSRNRDSMSKTKHGRHSLDAGLSTGSGDGRNRSSTYEEDFRRAVELSLQEAAKQAGSSSSAQPTDQPSSSGLSTRGQVN
ncbi:ankyrin repeat and IBR domain-containing protein 1-like [Amphiura filiformis]|uniref:ankyrin repeat and IBR domain-containing protein 1-like n=1 Tax=Amphiura filiformis TaxID=82378 RepID=UPI003B21D261